MPTGEAVVEPPRQNILSRFWNSPPIQRAPWMLYFFLGLVAVGVAIMCVRFQLGDAVTASISAALTCGLILTVGVVVYISLRRGGDDSPPSSRRKKRVTVCLKAHQFTDEDIGEKSDTTCAICLVEMEGGEKVVTLDCGHVYHVDCICNWTRRVAVCPACRYNLPVTVASAETSVAPTPVPDSPV